MKLKPLHDRIVVKRVEEEETTKSGLFIPQQAKEKPVQGIVISVGPGIYRDGVLQPVGVKPDEKVLFGKYSGTEVELDGEKLLILRSDEIMGTVEE